MLRDGAWEGERAFIIGGGPSLRRFDFSQLSGEKVVGVNKAYTTGVCDVVVARDRRFWRWVNEDPRLLDVPHLVWAENARGDEFPHLPLQILKPNEKKWATSFEEGVYSAPDSGLRAINVADILRADPIYLLGFDMRGEGEYQAHWHEGYQVRQKARVYDNFMKGYLRAASY